MWVGLVFTESRRGRDRADRRPSSGLDGARDAKHIGSTASQFKTNFLLYRELLIWLSLGPPPRPPPALFLGGYRPPDTPVGGLPPPKPPAGDLGGGSLPTMESLGREP